MLIIFPWTLGRLLNGYGFGEFLGNHGGMVSDFLRVPYAAATLVAAPDRTDPAVLAPASDNIPDAGRTVAPMLKKHPGAPVLIVGGGAKSIGLYATGIAKAPGSTHVDYLDGNAKRLEIAQELGANPVQFKTSDMWFRRGELPGLNKPLITVDASASVSGLHYALRSLAPGGRCTSVCFCFRKGTPVPLFQMYLNSSTLYLGVSPPRAVLPEVLELIVKGDFRPGIVTTLQTLKKRRSSRGQGSSGSSRPRRTPRSWLAGKTCWKFTPSRLTPGRPLGCLDEAGRGLVADTRTPPPPKPGRRARHDFEHGRAGARATEPGSTLPPSSKRSALNFTPPPKRSCGSRISSTPTTPPASTRRSRLPRHAAWPGGWKSSLLPGTAPGGTWPKSNARSWPAHAWIANRTFTPELDAGVLRRLEEYARALCRGLPPGQKENDRPAMQSIGISLGGVKNSFTKPSPL